MVFFLVSVLCQFSQAATKSFAKKLKTEHMVSLSPLNINNCLKRLKITILFNNKTPKFIKRAIETFEQNKPILGVFEDFKCLKSAFLD